MNGSKGVSPCKVLAYVAVLLGAMTTTLLLPAYGQQEVAPDWYDPYAVPNAIANTAAVHPAQAPVAFHQHQPVVTSVSSAPSVEKSRRKRPAAAPMIPAVGVLTDPRPREKGGSMAR
ncbi:MAG: hypothetical protein WB660_16330 [Candidatus Sulfotelmatobacter sp.]